MSHWPEPRRKHSISGWVDEKSASLSRKQALEGNNSKVCREGWGRGTHKESQAKLDTSMEY